MQTAYALAGKNGKIDFDTVADSEISAKHEALHKSMGELYEDAGDRHLDVRWREILEDMQVVKIEIRISGE